MEKPYKYDEWKATLDKNNPTKDALTSYASLVERMIQCPTGVAARGAVLNAKPYIEYFLYETDQQDNT